MVDDATDGNVIGDAENPADDLAQFLRGGDPSRKIYLRPIALLSGWVAVDAIRQGHALSLAGGDIAFTACEVTTRSRNNPGPPRRYLAGVPELRSTDVSDDMLGLLVPLTSARPPVCGLTFDRTQVMGVVNVTPDSFSDGGDHMRPDQAVAHAIDLIDSGADLLDIGGESTRPGAQPVSLGEELDRILPVIRGLASMPVPLSVDTRKAAVMEQAAKAGVALINDVSALTHDPQAMATIAAGDLPVILMHSLDDPQVMQDDPRYEDVALDIFDYLRDRIDACVAAGIDRNRILVDPGIGFGKTLAHNLALLEQLTLFHGLGCPLVLGVSRKRFIAAVSDEEQFGEESATKPGNRLGGSLSAAMAGLAQGVQILRVHDVAETVQAAKVWKAANNGTIAGNSC